MKKREKKKDFVVCGCKQEFQKKILFSRKRDFFNKGNLPLVFNFCLRSEFSSFYNFPEARRKTPSFLPFSFLNMDKVESPPSWAKEYIGDSNHWISICPQTGMFIAGTDKDPS